MNIRMIIQVGIPLVGGIILLAGRTRRARQDSPIWVGNVLVLAGITAITYAILAFLRASQSRTTAIYLDHYRTLLGGFAVGCLITLHISGQLLPSKWKKKKDSQPADGAYVSPATGDPSAQPAGSDYRATRSA